MPHQEQGSKRVTTQTAAGIVPEGDHSDNLAGLGRSQRCLVVVALAAQPSHDDQANEPERPEGRRRRVHRAQRIHGESGSALARTDSETQ
jgi:hypothetical protein